MWYIIVRRRYNSSKSCCKYIMWSEFVRYIDVNISEVGVFKSSVCGHTLFHGRRCHTMCKIAYGDILWVHNIYYEILWLFLISPSSLLTSAHVNFPTNLPIPILLPNIFRLQLIIWFIWLLTFPDILCVYPTNCFVQSLLQLSFFHFSYFVFCNLLQPFCAYSLHSWSEHYILHYYLQPEVQGAQQVHLFESNNGHLWTTTSR